MSAWDGVSEAILSTEVDDQGGEIDGDLVDSVGSCTF